MVLSDIPKVTITETKIRLAMMMQKGQWADDEYCESVLVVLNIISVIF